MKILNAKNVFAAAFLIVASAAGISAQTRQPSSPIRPFVVKTKQSVADLEKSLRTDNKVEDLTGGEGTQLRVAVQHDKLRENADAEVHDASDDVYYVLEGEANLTLGGKLENPREKQSQASGKAKQSSAGKLSR